MVKGNVVSLDGTTFHGSLNAVSQNGDLTIIGDSTDGNIHLTATPFVMAPPNDPSTALALADVAAGISLSGDTVGCSFASQAHGDIGRDATGCVDFVVHIPPGTPQAPDTVTAQTNNGPLTIRGVNLKDHNCLINDEPATCPLMYLQPPVALADKGDVTVTGVTGSVVAQSNGGNVTVSVTPNAPQPGGPPFGGTIASYVVIQSTNGNAALSLPSDFTADAINLTLEPPDGGTITITGFPDLYANSLSRGDAGTGARLVDVTANQGDVTLSAIQTH